MSSARRSTLGLTVAALASLVLIGRWIVLEPTVEARQVLDPADPAFATAVSVPLPPTPLGPNTFFIEFQANGVSFRIESLTSFALNPFGGGNGILVSGFGADEGVLVTASPPVLALGFRGTELDGCPGVVFAGTQGTETVDAPFPCPPGQFLGAADIGPIGTARLHRSASIFLVTEMLFVPSGGSAPTSDLGIDKLESRGSVGTALGGETLHYDLDVRNEGPDQGDNVLITDFLPPGFVFSDVSGGGVYDADENLVRFTPGNFAAGSNTMYTIDGFTPLDPLAFSCDARLTNIAAVSSLSADPVLENNLSVATTFFNNAALRNEREICGDGIDNNCDGRVDCGDPASCNCRPTLPPLPGGNPQCWTGIIEGPPGMPPIIVTGCTGEDNEAPNHACRVPRGRCGNKTLPAYCCDPSRLSNPSLDNLMALRRCDVGIPGCAPVDPNFKESDPPVNTAGYGYTDAGRTMSYTLHYENIGNADALDVKIIDVLDPDLDDTTLVIQDGGLYDPGTRALVWTDPVLPPAEPRTVSFQIDVRADAEPGTVVRNDGTIVFPNAVPPSRVDTELVEHVVRDPQLPIVPDFRIRGCTEAGPGLWRVELINDGLGFAYDVTAAIVGAPAAVTVVEPTASFSHPDDEDPNLLATVIPNATTTSDDTVELTTLAATDPCAVLNWRIDWENLRGDRFTSTVPGAPDGDEDGVADDADNCPATPNSDQADGDGDGIGDACDAPEPLACDVDGDGDVDRDDVGGIFAARNQTASGADDPRDRDGDGVITVNDARQCVLECTRASCAVD